MTWVETQLRDMDGMGIDIRAMSPAPQYCYWTDPELGRETARLLKIKLPSGSTKAAMKSAPTKKRGTAKAKIKTKNKIKTKKKSAQRRSMR